MKNKVLARGGFRSDAGGEIGQRAAAGRGIDFWIRAVFSIFLGDGQTHLTLAGSGPVLRKPDVAGEGESGGFGVRADVHSFTECAGLIDDDVVRETAFAAVHERGSAVFLED